MEGLTVNHRHLVTTSLLLSIIKLFVDVQICTIMYNFRNIYIVP